MKKSLIFSFVFFATILLSLSLISAGLWITGDVGQKAGTTTVRATSIKSSDTDAFTRTATATRGTSSSSQNNQEKGPRGWAPATTADGKRCWIPPAKSKGLFGRR